MKELVTKNPVSWDYFIKRYFRDETRCTKTIGNEHPVDLFFINNKYVAQKDCSGFGSPNTYYNLIIFDHEPTIKEIEENIFPDFDDTKLNEVKINDIDDYIKERKDISRLLKEKFLNIEEI